MKNGKIIVPVGRLPWTHEMRVANALATMGYTVEFLPERSIKTADILLDGVEFEIKSPRSGNANSLEHILKKALRQSSNIIVDTCRIKDKNDDSITKFLIKQVRVRRRIKQLILVTRHVPTARLLFCFLIERFAVVNFWRRSGTIKAKNGRGESPIVVVGRVDVVGVVEVETLVGPAIVKCQGEVT